MMPPHPTRTRASAAWERPHWMTVLLAITTVVGTLIGCVVGAVWASSSAREAAAIATTGREQLSSDEFLKGQRIKAYGQLLVASSEYTTATKDLHLKYINGAEDQLQGALANQPPASSEFLTAGNVVRVVASREARELSEALSVTQGGFAALVEKSIIAQRDYTAQDQASQDAYQAEVDRYAADVETALIAFVEATRNDIGSG